MSVRRFRAVPLTPIHVGTGERIAREEYVVDGNRLIRFNPHAVIADLAPAELARYEQMLDRNELDGAVAFLRKYGKLPNYQLYAAEMGRSAQRELAEVVSGRQRGEVNPLLRNPVSGEVIIPGSSLKGAIRTAVVSCLANMPPLKAGVTAAVEAGKQDRDWRRRGGVCEALESKALDRPPRNTERDPLRMLKLSDAVLPAGAARVDRAYVITRTRPEGGSEKMRMYYERLRCQADGVGAPTFTVEIRLEEDQGKHPKVRELLRRPLSWDLLVQACNMFYWKRLKEEKETFYPAAKWTWVPKPSRSSVLLRLGRFSHFESLSVEGLRDGWNVQAKQPIAGMGASRTVCEVGTGGRMPFGWLWLEPLGET